MLSTENSPGKWISHIHRFSQSYLARKLKRFNIGGWQFHFLMKLFKEDGIKQETLVEALNIDKGTTARAIANLEQNGYLIRKVNPEDKRSNQVYLTEKANNIKQDIYQELYELNELLQKGLTDEERQTLLGLLKKVAQNTATK